MHGIEAHDALEGRAVWSSAELVPRYAGATAETVVGLAQPARAIVRAKSRRVCMGPPECVRIALWPEQQAGAGRKRLDEILATRAIVVNHELLRRCACKHEVAPVHGETVFLAEAKTLRVASSSLGQDIRDRV